MIKTVLSSAAIGAIFVCSSAFAQSISNDTPTAAPGGSAAVTSTFAAGADVAGIDYQLTYDSTNLSVSSCTAGTLGGFFDCNFATAGQVNIAVANASALPSGTLATIQFDVAMGAPDNTTIPFMTGMIECSDSSAVATSCSVSDPGGIAVQSGPPPSLSFVPADGNIAISTQPGIDGTAVATVSNVAAAGSQNLNLDCSFSTAAPEITSSLIGTASIPAGGSADVTVTCSSAAEGTFNATYTCTDNAPEADLVFNIACNVQDIPPVAVFSPPNGGNLLIGPILAGNTEQGAVAFSETGGTTGYSVSNCTVMDDMMPVQKGAAPVFALAGPNGGSVPAGGTLEIPITATAPPDGTSPTGTLTCDVAGVDGVTTYSISLGLLFRPLVIPTLSQWGLAIMALLMGIFTVVSVRRRAA